MSESTHSTYKTEFLQKKHAQNNHEHFKNLDEFMDYYCNQRYPFDHFGLTPSEVLNGEIPDRRRFSEDIQIARIKRIEKNRVFNKCPFSVQVAESTVTKIILGFTQN